MWKNLMSWINYFLIYKSEVLDSNSVISADIRSSISVSSLVFMKAPN